MKLFRRKRLRELYILALLITILMSYLFYLNDSNNYSRKVYARNGVIDLTDWNLHREIKLKLVGSWEYYPDELLSFEEIKNRDSKSKNYFHFPGIWTKDIWSLHSDVGNGFGTFRLKVLLPRQEMQLALYSQEQATAYRFFIENMELGGAGRVGKSKKDYLPLTVPSIFFFDTYKNEINIILQISNFDHRKGGPRKNIYLGTQSNLLKLKSDESQRDIFVSGILFAFILYHISIFIYRRREITNFIFSIFCLIVFLRVLTTGEILLVSIFPFINYEILIRVEYFSLFTGSAFGMHFLRLVFPYDFPARFIKISYIKALVFNLLLFTSIKFFTYFLPIFQFIMFIEIVFGLSFLVKSIRKRRKNSFFISLGFVPVILFTINDVLYSNDLLDTGYYLHYGFMILLFFQSFILSFKYSKIMDLNEELNDNLERKVLRRTDQLKKEIQERKVLNDELEETMRIISRDLKLAQKIQEKILPRKTGGDTFFEYVYEYMPLQIVGGDFINIEKFDGKLRYMICDITGHGIQASLITFIIKSEYEELKMKIETPHEILLELNYLFLSKYRSLELNFPCFIADIFFKEEKLIYSSAGFPEQFVVGKNRVEGLGATSPMLGFPIREMYQDREVEFPSGSKFISFSDGIIESQNRAMEFFGNQNYKKMVVDILDNNDIRNALDIILKKEEQFRNGSPRMDDLTIFLLEKY